MTNEIQLKESMSEKEIVEYLKANKTMGVALAFMPPDVRRWCEKHQNDDIFMIFDSDYKWVNIVCPPINLGPRTIYSIKDDYEPKPEFKPHFVEFDIDENGYFYYEGKQYYYREDVAFEKRNSDTFKGFGGWLYEGKAFDSWTTTINLLYGGCLYNYLRSDQNAYETTAPIPIKIRFWRYRE